MTGKFLPSKFGSAILIKEQVKAQIPVCWNHEHNLRTLYPHISFTSFFATECQCQIISPSLSQAQINANIGFYQNTRKDWAQTVYATCRVEVPGIQ